MTDLLHIFKQRDDHYTKMTDLILEVLNDPIIEGTKEFLQSQESQLNGILEWDEITLIDGLIILIGVMTYSPGTTITLGDGKVVVVSEQNVDYFNRVIRVGIPLQIALEGNKADVISFLQKTLDEPSNSETESSDKNLNNKSSIAAINDFDLEQLTEKQKSALFVFNSGGTQ